MIEAKEPLKLRVSTVDGIEKEVSLSPEEYYLNEKGKAIVFHDALQNLGDRIGGVASKIETKMEYGVFQNPRNFCFVYRARAEFNGFCFEEVGESNPANLLDNPDKRGWNIGLRYPAIMADKRARDRLLIRLLGLKGQIMSDIEFVLSEGEEGKSERAKNEDSLNFDEDPTRSFEADFNPFDALNEDFSPKEKEEEKEKDEEIEKLFSLPVAIGKYKEKPTTLGECLKNDPNVVKWLAGESVNGRPGYRVSERSSSMMKELHEAARRLLSAS